jgi:hypothetical protein
MTALSAFILGASLGTVLGVILMAALCAGKRIEPLPGIIWEPISQAPKNGGVILLGRADFRPELSSWRADIPNYSWPTLSARDRFGAFSRPTHFAVIASEPPEGAA